MQKNKSINKEGIGLGLYITKNLAVELGGKIIVDSKENHFTRFVLTLPVSHSFVKLKKDKDDAQLLKSGAEPIELPLDSERVLLSDISKFELQTCSMKKFQRNILSDRKVMTEQDLGQHDDDQSLTSSQEPSSNEFNFNQS